MLTNKLPYSVEQPWLPFSEALLNWDEAFHQLMLDDKLRMHAYEKAIKETVKPGDIVVDLGTGTGILSLWALEAGASCVYGIDLNPDILALAEKMMSQHKFDDRFIAINKLSYDVILPERADVLISEIIGNMADNEDFQPILNDAIRRFLKPGGKCLPKDTCAYIVPITAKKAHSAIQMREVKTLNPNYQLDKLMQEKSIRNPFNLYYDTLIEKSAQLGSPQRLQYYHDDWSQQPVYCKVRSFVVEQDAVFTGFQCYFIADLSDTVSLDISGDDQSLHSCSDSWKHAYLPIEQCISVRKDDVISLSFSRYYPDDINALQFRQIYRWRGHVERDGRHYSTFDQCMDERVFSDLGLNRYKVQRKEGSQTEEGFHF